MSAPSPSRSMRWPPPLGTCYPRAWPRARRRPASVCPAPSRSGNPAGRHRTPRRGGDGADHRQQEKQEEETTMKMNLRAATIGLAAALIAATSGLAARAEDKPVYGVLLKTLSNPFWGAMEQGIRDGAKEADVEYFMQAVESDQAAEPQLNTCNTM